MRVSEEKDGEKSIEISSLPRKKKQVKIQTANGSVFTMLFVQKRKKWLPVDLPIEQPNQSVVVQRPATYYMSADGVLCTNEGKKLGEAAVSYYVDTHKRKIEQKKTAEINVFYPLENEIDEGAAIAYAEKKKTKEVEKQRFATDKKMILLIEAMRNKHHDKIMTLSTKAQTPKDPYLSSDDDDDLTKLEKEDAFREASKFCLAQLKVKYIEIKNTKRHP